MNREVVDKWCERGILALVLGILVFGPLALGAVRGLEFAVIQGLTLGVMALWAVRLWVDPHPRLLWPPICWAVVAFALYAIFRYFTSDIEYLARHEVLQVLVYTFLFFAVLNNLHGQESTQIITFTLIFLAMVISAYAVYQFVTDSHYVWRLVSTYPHRGSGTYYCPNHLGGFLEMLLPLALTYTISGRLKPVTKILIGYAALVMVAGMVATVSRGTWLATGLALLFLFAAMLFRPRYRLPALLLLVVLSLGSVLFVPRSVFFQRRLHQIVNDKGRPDDGLRFAVWGPAWRMWRENPWLGVGPDHFDTRFRAYRPEGIQLSPGRVHNDYLNTLADWGAVGAVLIAAAWGLLAWGIVKTWKYVRPSGAELGKRSGSNKFAFVLGASLGLLALLAHSFVDFNLHIPANAILCVVLMALLTSHLRFATEKFWSRPGVIVRGLVTLTIFAGLGYLAPQALRMGREFVWLNRASHAPAFSPVEIEYLTNAFAIEPSNPQTAYAIAEAYRRESQEGGEFYQGRENVDYRQLATRAMDWFQRGMKLNPYDSRNFAGYGWCLDWLDRSAESAPYFDKAEALDPNNYFNVNFIGLHYLQTGDLAAARPWFERSLRLQWEGNDIARNYLAIVNARMLEAATNDITARLQSAER